MKEVLTAENGKKRYVYLASHHTFIIVILVQIQWSQRRKYIGLFKVPADS